MNNSKLTIRWSRNEDGGTDISVCGEVNFLCHVSKRHFYHLIYLSPYTIRKFAEIIGVDIDERKFSDRREFQRYFRQLMKDVLEKEDW